MSAAMLFSANFLLALLHITAVNALNTTSNTTPLCKPLPSDSTWPSLQQWRSLNDSISGRLSVPLPPGFVCHTNSSSSSLCEFIADQWTNTTFHSLDPVSVDYNDETCLPDSTEPCSGHGYPRYVITAQTVQDVQAGVNFARETGVRLVIKGTGHDHPGRSSGPDSLAIYTHNIRGLSIIQEEGETSSSSSSQPLLKIAAGEQMRDIYGIASLNNLTVVGGADPDVGIGGWMSGGGHGPLSASHGLGADQVVEIEVVTADGEFKTINGASSGEDGELFWAMRGGGAGTFAVLISVTVKTYPAITAGGVVTLVFSTTTDSKTFWDMAAYFHSQLPSLAEAGLVSYYNVVPYVASATSNNETATGQLSSSWLAPGLSTAELLAKLEPLTAVIGGAVKNNVSWATDAITVQSIIEPQSGTFMDWWLTYYPAQTAGTIGRVGSRLLTNTSLLGPISDLKNALRTSTPAGETMVGQVVGPAPSSSAGDGDVVDNAVLDAWRQTYTHVSLPRTWTAFNQTQKLLVATDLRDVRTQALRKVEPESGCYMSEADPTEPEWQRAKFGAKYARLLGIKTRVDPLGVFWCKQCVGSELWNVLGQEEVDVENGVGQSRVRMCWKS